jgi:hypothetical protein
MVLRDLVSVRPYNNVPGICQRSEPFGQINGIACQTVAAFADIFIAGYYQTCIDTGVHLQRGMVCFFKGRAQIFDQFMNFKSCMNGADGIIFMGLWHSEQDHDLISEEPLHGATIFIHNAFGLFKDVSHQVFHLFGIQFFGHGGVAGQI